MKRNNKKYFLLVIAFACLFIQCNKQTDNSPIVAQVGNSSLTLDELKSQLGNDNSELMSTDYLQSYVYRWVDNEVIYQSALTEGVDKLPLIQNELEKLKRDLIIGYYLDNQVSRSQDISEEDISRYYEENANSFKRNNMEYRYSYLVCKDRQTAQRVKTELNEIGFETAVKNNYPQDIFNNHWDSGYVAIENVLLSLQKDIARQRISRIYGPVAGDGGFIIYQLVEKHDANSVRDISLVRDQIIRRLHEREYRGRYKELMVLLKSNKKIELNLVSLEEQINADTTLKKQEGSL